MLIRARMSMSADGYVTTPGGWPALVADPAFVSGESHGIKEFLADCGQALMGRTTFEPALTNDRWPWATLQVFVLASARLAGTRITSSPTATRAGCSKRSAKPTRAATCTSSAGLGRSRRSTRSARVDRLELVVLPVLFGGGMRLTDSLSSETGLTFERERALPRGSVEIVYSVAGSSSEVPGRDAGWTPPSQRR